MLRVLERETVKQGLRWAGVSLLGLGFSMLAVEILVSGIGLRPYWAYLITVTVVYILDAGLTAKLVFRAPIRLAPSLAYLVSSTIFALVGGVILESFVQIPLHPAVAVFLTQAAMFPAKFLVSRWILKGGSN
jgi:hypothetical protein